MTNTKTAVASLISQAELKDLVNYDLKTGLFTWKESPRHTEGAPVGSLTTHGYLVVALNGRQYYLHRLAWLWLNGEFPISKICCDHINGVRTDNRFLNLRLCSRGKNRQNLHKAGKNNTSTGVLGVYKAGKKFIARISYDFKTYNLGSFETVMIAQKAYVKAKQQLHNFGELA